MPSRSFARTALLLSCAWVVVTGIFYYPKWKYGGTEATISWDVSGYYFYLPSIFIYHDLKEQKFKDSLLAKYQPTTSPYQSYQYSNGHYVMKYASGMALMYAPFFWTAHLLARPLGYEPDGFSYPYQLAIGLGSILIALIGLLLLYKMLSLYFSSRTTGTVLLLYVFGTNYLEYSAITNAMSHNYLFTVYAALLYVTIRFYQRPSYGSAALIGLLCGLATLTRPTEIISLVIPLLWGIDSKQAFRSRFSFFAKHYGKIALAAFLFAGMVGIQFAYWKYVSGHWLVYSYQNEKLEFLHPHIYKCLLSFRKGWFIYTPLMLLIIPGYVYLYRKRPPLFWVSFVFGLVFMYLCFSWSIWWYAGSIGQRAMVQAYPLLALPFAAAIEKIDGNTMRRLIFFPLILLATYYNLWLTHQAHRGGLLDPENMTRAYWAKVVLRYTMPAGAEKLLDTDEEFTGERKEVEPLLVSRDTVLLDGGHQFSKVYPFTIPPNHFQWVRVQALVSIGQKEWNIWKMTQLIVRFRKGGQVIKDKYIRLQRLLKEGEKKDIFMDVRIPGDFDAAEVQFWNPGSPCPFYLLHFSIEVFKEA